MSRLKYLRIREKLRQQIVSGIYPPGSRLPAETELPERLHASKITVVRALNDLVKEGLIVRSRKRGSFVAEPCLRPIIPGRKLKIGVLFPHSVFPDFRAGLFQYQILRGILTAWGMACAAPQCPTLDTKRLTCVKFCVPSFGLEIEALGEGMDERPRHPRLGAFEANGYDGFIVLSIVNEEFVDQLLDLGAPTVLVDFPNQQFVSRADQVFLDPTIGYGDAVRHFAAIGLKRIFFLGAWLHKQGVLSGSTICYDECDALPDPDSFVRMAAWQQAMSGAGLKMSDNWVHFAWSDPKPLRERANQLAALPIGLRPEAVLCHSYVQAQHVIGAFAEQGLRLHAAGATDSGADSGLALPIHADGHALGQAAAALMTWKLQQQRRPMLRVGVPMHFCQSGTVTGRGVPPAISATNSLGAVSGK